MLFTTKLPSEATDTAVSPQLQTNSGQHTLGAREKGGSLSQHLMGAVDDGGWRAYIPLTLDFLVSPDGDQGIWL